MKIGNLHTLSLALAGGTLSVAAVFTTAGSAHAATSWNATGTQADVVGSWAHGTLDVVNDRTVVSVTVTDSAGDHASARVYFRWRYIDGGKSGAAMLTASGKGNSKSATYREPRGALDTYDPFEVSECRVDNGIEVECGGWDVPYPFND
ncbi:hypothetical protein ACWCQW_53655 [Streptomyces mirabilis]